MHTPTEMSPLQNRKHAHSKPALVKRLLFWFVFVLCWAALIGGGIYGSYYYLEQVKADLIAEVDARNAVQLESLRQDYESQIALFKEQVTQSFSRIEAEVTSLNELLIFTRDSANQDFDSSNQLYTQLNRLEEQLNQLKKNMEVLK